MGTRPYASWDSEIHGLGNFGIRGLEGYILLEHLNSLPGKCGVISFGFEGPFGSRSYSVPAISAVFLCGFEDIFWILKI